MPIEVWVAVLGVVGAGVTAAIGAFVGPPVKSWFEKRNQAAALRSRYIPPLLQASFDLQSRLYNIVRQDFLRSYVPAGGEYQQYAERSTLWLLGQYLGWVEIMRREGQFLDFGKKKKNRGLQRALSEIAHELSTDERGPLCAVFRGQQRAIGELMIREVHTPGEADLKQEDCLGYAEFVQRLDKDAKTNATDESPDLAPWFERLTSDLQVLAKEEAYDRHDRLIRVQRALIDLVDQLDADRVRYPDVNTRGRLPLLGESAGIGQNGGLAPIARFKARPGEYPVRYRQGFPLRLLDEWAEENRLELIHGGENWEVYQEKPRYYGASPYVAARLVLHVVHTDDTVDLYGSALAPGWAHHLPMTKANLTLQPRAWRFIWSRRRARRIVNDLLSRFDRPVLR